MAASDYTKARKLAQKAYHQAVSAGKHPYLQVLDELLAFTETAGETDLGLIEIPVSLIAGTKTAGRTKAFSCSFMPLLKEDTEFASKWTSLFQSHLNEGIHEPVIACEFLNSYYIIEGNKRTSVLKYSGAVTVPGYVTRIIPVPDDSDASKIYFEFMEFSRITGIYTIYFSRPGSFKELCRLTGKPYGIRWTEEERRNFSSSFYYFSKAFEEKGGEKLAVTAGDALLLYLDVYGYEGMEKRSMEELSNALGNLWRDLEALLLSCDVNLVMQPEKEPSPIPGQHFFKKLITPSPQKLTVGFLYYKTAKTSSWTYGHDLGRLYLEDSMADRLSIRVYDKIESESDCQDSIEQAIADGCSVIFTTTPRFLEASIKAGIKYPRIKILNCSLNSYTGHLRTYYGRLYEAKFLLGMLAGILTREETIGYIADYPIYGATAAANAFALGTKMVNPTARVHLVWSSEKNYNLQKTLSKEKISHICGRDTMLPGHTMRYYGLYDLDDENGGNLAAAIWHWGKFYQRILQTILNGNWDRSAQETMGESLNYWWGISSGMIDMITSNDIPERTLRLIDMVRKQIVSGEFQIFSGDLYDQNHIRKNHGSQELNPKEIISMNWLLDNISGHIPAIEELKEESVPMVEIQGILSMEQRSLT